MKNFADPPLPLNMGLLTSFHYFTFYLLLEPSLSQVGLIVFFDIISLIYATLIHWKFFTYRNPEYQNISSEIEKDYSKGSLSEKRQIFELLMAFPQKMTNSMRIENHIKLIPAYCLILYILFQSELLWFKLIVFLAIFQSFNEGFLKGVYLTSTKFCAEKIQELHTKYDFSDIFFELGDREVKDKKYILPYKNLIITSLAVFITYFDYESRTFPLTGFLLFGGNLIFVFILIDKRNKDEKQTFLNRQKTIQEQILNVCVAGDTKAVAIHPDPEIKRLEISINDVIKELNKEREALASRIEQDVIQSRIMTVGELSSGIFHDISTPLQTLKLGHELLKRNPKLAEDESFIHDQKLSLDKAFSMIEAVRNYLRNPTIDDRKSFDEIYNNIKEILNSKYNVALLEKAVQVDPQLKGYQLNVNSTLATHILFNLINNALAHLVEKKIPDPKILVKYRVDENKDEYIAIQDNGKGVDPKWFEEATSIRIDPMEGRGSLGLWLVKRMVERSGGALSLLDGAEQKGTTIEWLLPNT